MSWEVGKDVLQGQPERPGNPVLLRGKQRQHGVLFWVRVKQIRWCKEPACACTLKRMLGRLEIHND